MPGVKRLRTVGELDGPSAASGPSTAATTGGASAASTSAAPAHALAKSLAGTPAAVASGERPASVDGDAASAAGDVGTRSRRRRQTDLRQDTIEDLRVQHRQLRTAAREAQRQVRNAKKRRNRVLTRLRNLDTASVLAVLMDRVSGPGAPPAQLEADVAAAVRAGVAPDALAERLGTAAPASPDAADSDADDSAAESEASGAERAAAVSGGEGADEPAAPDATEAEEPANGEIIPEAEISS
jgi:hypothetical protein